MGLAEFLWLRVVRAAGSELLTAPFVECLQKLLQPAAVVLRNDSFLRQLERDPSMKQYAAVVAGG